MTVEITFINGDTLTLLHVKKTEMDKNSAYIAFYRETGRFEEGQGHLGSFPLVNIQRWLVKE